MRINQHIAEALSQGVCEAIEMSGWERLTHPLAASAIRTSQLGQPLVLKCSPQVTGLQFLRHGWSGAVKITTKAGERTLALSLSEDTDVLIFDLEPSECEFEVRIEAVAVASRAVERCEVWILGVVVDGVDKPVGGSILLNADTRLIYGDWGEFLVLSHDEVIPTSILIEGAWAPNDIKIFREHVNPGDLVIDVGSNFGHHAIVFSKLVGADGAVIAVEAQRLMYQLVHANSAINKCRNILPINAAAGSDHGSVKMYPINYDSSHNLGALGIDINKEHEDEGETISQLPVDYIVDKYADNRRVAFVKIDVQAYELFVIQGMDKILTRDRPKIFVEISPLWMRRAGYDYREIYRLLRRYGYEFSHRPGTILGADGMPEVGPDEDVEWDLLAVHPAG